MWSTWTLPVADLVFSVADIVVADMVCGRYRCNSNLTHYGHYQKSTTTKEDIFFEQIFFDLRYLNGPMAAYVFPAIIIM